MQLKRMMLARQAEDAARGMPAAEAKRGARAAVTFHSPVAGRGDSGAHSSPAGSSIVARPPSAEASHHHHKPEHTAATMVAQADARPVAAAPVILAPPPMEVEETEGPTQAKAGLSVPGIDTDVDPAFPALPSSTQASAHLASAAAHEANQESPTRVAEPRAPAAGLASDESMAPPLQADSSQPWHEPSEDQAPKVEGNSPATSFVEPPSPGTLRTVSIIDGWHAPSVETPPQSSSEAAAAPRGRKDPATPQPPRRVATATSRRPRARSRSSSGHGRATTTPPAATPTIAVAPQLQSSARAEARKAYFDSTRTAREAEQAARVQKRLEAAASARLRSHSQASNGGESTAGHANDRRSSTGSVRASRSGQQALSLVRRLIQRRRQAARKVEEEAQREAARREARQQQVASAKRRSVVGSAPAEGRRHSNCSSGSGTVSLELGDDVRQVEECSYPSSAASSRRGSVQHRQRSSSGGSGMASLLARIRSLHEAQAATIEATKSEAAKVGQELQDIHRAGSGSSSNVWQQLEGVRSMKGSKVGIDSAREGATQPTQPTQPTRRRSTGRKAAKADDATPLSPIRCVTAPAVPRTKPTRPQVLVPRPPSKRRPARPTNDGSTDASPAKQSRAATTVPSPSSGPSKSDLRIERARSRRQAHLRSRSEGAQLPSVSALVSAEDKATDKESLRGNTRSANSSPRAMRSRKGASALDVESRYALNQVIRTPEEAALVRLVQRSSQGQAQERAMQALVSSSLKGSKRSEHRPGDKATDTATSPRHSNNGSMSQTAPTVAAENKATTEAPTTSEPHGVDSSSMSGLGSNGGRRKGGHSGRGRLHLGSERARLAQALAVAAATEQMEIGDGVASGSMRSGALDTSSPAPPGGVATAESATVPHERQRRESGSSYDSSLGEAFWDGAGDAVIEWMGTSRDSPTFRHLIAEASQHACRTLNIHCYACQRDIAAMRHRLDFQRRLDKLYDQPSVNQNDEGEPTPERIARVSYDAEVGGSRTVESPRGSVQRSLDGIPRNETSTMPTTVAALLPLATPTPRGPGGCTTPRLRRVLISPPRAINPSVKGPETTPAPVLTSPVLTPRLSVQQAQATLASVRAVTRGSRRMQYRQDLAASITAPGVGATAAGIHDASWPGDGKKAFAGTARHAYTADVNEVTHTPRCTYPSLLGTSSSSHAKSKRGTHTPWHEIFVPRNPLAPRSPRRHGLVGKSRVPTAPSPRGSTAASPRPMSRHVAAMTPKQLNKYLRARM